MSNILDEICAKKREHIAAQKKIRSLADLEETAKNASKTRGFEHELDSASVIGAYGLIAEIKRASPSKGVIRENFDVVALAKAYEAGGANCLSVVTDGPYFQGDDADLAAARDAVSIPVLRKDFILDPYQVVESRALGADCILLIMAVLEDSQAIELENLARQYIMDVLVEVHNEEEMDRALNLQTRLIGINNRNLNTLEVDLEVTEDLAPIAPLGRIVVSESGIRTPEDVSRMAESGALCFLVGESLMVQDDVEAAIKHLLSL